MTHAYGDCGGVRYLTNGLKVTAAAQQLPIHLQLVQQAVSSFCMHGQYLAEVHQQDDMVHGQV